MTVPHNAALITNPCINDDRDHTDCICCSPPLITAVS